MLRNFIKEVFYSKKIKDILAEAEEKKKEWKWTKEEEIKTFKEIAKQNLLNLTDENIKEIYNGVNSFENSWFYTFYKISLKKSPIREYFTEEEFKLLMALSYLGMLDEQRGEYFNTILAELDIKEEIKGVAYLIYNLYHKHIKDNKKNIEKY